MKLKKIIINGAGSYISINLIKKFLEEDYEVYALSTNKEKLLQHFSNDKLHIYSYVELHKIPGEADVFIYMAWLNSDSAGRSSIKMQKENLDFAIDQITFIQNLKCKKVLFANSFYVKELNSLLVNDNKKINPKYNYAIFKKTVSDILKLNLKDNHFIDLYISNVYGPFENNNRFITYIFNCLKNNHQINLSNTNNDFLYDFIYIDDAVELIYNIAINLNKYDSYDVCSNTPKLFSEYIYELFNLLNLDNTMIKYNKSVYQNPKLNIEDFKFERNNQEYKFLCKYSFKEGIDKIWGYEINASKTNKR